MNKYKIIFFALFCVVLPSCSKVDAGTRKVEKTIPSDLTEPEGVDMGPSFDVLWASVNVGASEPSQAGLSFAWGERAVYNLEGWDVYGLCDGTSGSLTRYCDNSYFGVVDNRSVLETKDDPASLLRGGKWRSPTIQEWKQLMECEWKWIDNYESSGMSGYEIISSANREVRLFLPATIRNQASYEGMRGCYWTSELKRYDPACASCLFFSEKYRLVDAAVRCTKYPVRAVRDK